MLEYWYVFPVAVFFSTIAMLIGVGGASMFTPFFYIVLNLPASIAVGAGLFIEVFGFGSGLYGFAKRKLIDYKIGTYLLCFTIPGALIGSLIGNSFPEFLIMGILSLTLLILALVMLKPENSLTVKDLEQKCDHKTGKCYVQPKSKGIINILSLFGGALAGVVSTGIGEINDYVLLKKYRMHGPLAAGTSVFVVALTVFIGTIVHSYNFLTHHSSMINQVLGIVVYAVPGVLIGSQIGVRLTQRIANELRNKIIVTLFFLLAVISFVSI